jgi:Flp pilus assembly protein TadG
MKRLRSLLGRGEEGSSSVSFVIMAPALVLVIGFLIFAGRISVAGNVVEGSAAAAARDASLARTSSPNVAIDTSGLRVPLGLVGTVHATVRCESEPQ